MKSNNKYLIILLSVAALFVALLYSPVGDPDAKGDILPIQQGVQLGGVITNAAHVGGNSDGNFYDSSIPIPENEINGHYGHIATHNAAPKVSVKLSGGVQMEVRIPAALYSAASSKDAAMQQLVEGGFSPAFQSYGTSAVASELFGADLAFNSTGSNGLNPTTSGLTGGGINDENSNAAIDGNEFGPQRGPNPDDGTGDLTPIPVGNGFWLLMLMTVVYAIIKTQIYSLFSKKTCDTFSGTNFRIYNFNTKSLIASSFTNKKKEKSTKDSSIHKFSISRLTK